MRSKIALEHVRNFQFTPEERPLSETYAISMAETFLRDNLGLLKCDYIRNTDVVGFDITLATKVRLYASADNHQSFHLDFFIDLTEDLAEQVSTIKRKVEEWRIMQRQHHRLAFPVKATYPVENDPQEA